MLAFLKALVLLPVAIAVVLLAVANRAPVVLSVDPFSKGAPELAVTLPLYGVILLAIALGVLLGGVGSWLASGRHRRASRMSGREINRLKAEADRLRSGLAASRPALPGPAARARPLRIVSAEAVDRALAFPPLVEALADAFRGGLAAPARHHHALPAPGAEATLLLMPAWSETEPRFAGVKIVTVYPDNSAHGLPSVIGTYLLLDGDTGRPLASLDGTRITLWRTAAASALAARHLARSDASRLLVVGAGALAPFLARAHAGQRPIREVAIWARRADAASALADALAVEGLPARAVADLENAALDADIVSCATLSSEPLVRGAWLKPGAHLDLVGAFNLAMREADDEALARASVFIDTPAARHEGGDVAVAIRAGTFDGARIRGDLADLVAGRHPGRTSPEEITLFKSIGASVEDLAAATMVWRRVSG